jgi:hypothetical protein
LEEKKEKKKEKKTHAFYCTVGYNTHMWSSSLVLFAIPVFHMLV